ncbi:MAG: alpha/beta fold hydrolase [Candidatus Helarchaeota archaeon]|nr:alpha/beta fold hydrolase [Candidatus Helarchaeota archaeon]
MTSADLTQIASLVYTPTDTSSNDLPGIVIGHGFVSNKQAMQGIALELVKCGFVVINIDFRGHGQSGGNLERDALIDDVYAAVQYLKNLPYVNNNSIGLVGHSMGGAAVMQTAITYKTEINATVSIGMVGMNDSNYEINGTDINNLLIAMGGLEELFTYEAMIAFLKNATDRVNVTDGVQYGYFINGTAKKLFIAPYADHILEITDSAIQNEICAWFRDSFYTGTTQPNTEIYRQIFGIIALLGAVIGFFVFIPYMKPVIYKNVKENPRKIEDPNATKKILLYIGGYCLVTMIAFLLLLPLSALFTQNLNLIMANFIIGLFMGYAIGLFLVFYLMHRYIDKDSRPFVRRIKEEISHNFKPSVLFGLVVFLFSFGSLTAILHWNMFDLLPTVRELGATLFVAILLFPYVFLDQLYIRNLQSYIPQGRIKELLKVVLLSSVAKIALFIPILFINLGLASIFVMILLLAFPLLEMLSTWVYMYSGRNIISPAIFTTLLLAWVLVAVMPFGNYSFTFI